MPFLSTSSFNVFVAATKAKASEVNSNFQTLANFFNTTTSEATIGTLYQRTVSTSGGMTLLTTDAIRTVLINVNTSAGYTLNLPTASASSLRELDIINTGRTTGSLILDGAGADTINNTLLRYVGPGDSIGLIGDGTQWIIKRFPTTLQIVNNNGIATNATSSGAGINILGSLGMTLTPGVWGANGTGILVAVTGSSQNNNASELSISTTQHSGIGANFGDDRVAMASALTNAEITGGAAMLLLNINDTKFTVSSVTVYYLNGTAYYGGTAPQWYGKMSAKMVG